MKSNLFIFVGSILLFLYSCTNLKLSEEQLVGKWVHPIESTIKLGNQEIKSYTYETFVFHENRSFVQGEYNKDGRALYENNGNWALSNTKTHIELFYDEGEKISLDIRNFDGKKFVTTSKMGNDFEFRKQ